MSDGTLRFNTKIDNTNVEKDLKDLERKIKSSQESISKNENAKLPLVTQMEKLNAQLEEAKRNLELIKADAAAAETAMQPGASPEDYLRASQDLPMLQASISDQEKEVARLQKQWDSVAAKVGSYDAKIQQANATITSNTAKINALGTQTKYSGTRMTSAFNKVRVAAARFAQRLMSIAKSVLIFSVLYRGLQKITQYMGKLLQTNEEYRNQMAQLRAALMTAFQPIYEFILPGLIAVLRVLTSIVMVVANVLSYLTGKTAKDSAEAAERLNDEAEAYGKVDKAAQKASKSLANFDEINTISSGSGGSSDPGGGPMPNFEGFSTAEYKAKIDELTVYMSGALLALGAILAFSGANIPLGIALMAAGALGLVTVLKENWGKLSNEVKTRITKVMGIVGGALLALGAILAFSGVSVGLGIGLMVAGAAGLATAAAVNWDSIMNFLESPIGQVMAAITESLVVIGVILAFAGNVSLGIALIKKYYGDEKTGVVDWNALPDNLKSVWGDIKSWFESDVAPKLTLTYWQNKFSWLKPFFGWIKKTIIDPLKTAFKEVWDAFSGYFSGEITFDELASSIGNTLKNLINKMIEAVNKLLSSICGKINQMIMKLKLFKILGIHPFRDMQTISPIPQIPKLAKGAVLPPNRPFMAMVGDQKNGTNVEAPLDTIKQALAEVMAMYGGNGDTVIRFEGDLAQLGRVLKPVIDRENSRVGASLATGGR